MKLIEHEDLRAIGVKNYHHIQYLLESVKVLLRDFEFDKNKSPFLGA